MQVGSNLDSSYLRISGQVMSENSTQNSKDENNTQETEELSPAQQAQVTELQARDTEVRAHEAAHLAAGAGVVTGGANFTYQRGPDNKQYAVGGEVPIDASGGRTPEETISKMQNIRAAALAPSDPSATDYQVASTATMLEMKARIELSQQIREEMQNEDNPYANSNDEDSDESAVDLVA